MPQKIVFAVKSLILPQFSKMKSLKILSFIISSLAFLTAVWIIVPAPDYRIWLFSVAASEWSLWIGLIALLGVILSIAARNFNGKSKWQLLPLTLSAAALLISLYPLLSVLQTARELNVSLSLKQYFVGVWSKNDSVKRFSTYTYAEINGTDLNLDVYSPDENTAKNGASVVVIHGGSWNGGHRSDFPAWNVWLTEHGFTVFDIDYKLAPQPNYLSAAGDVKCAVRWIKEHAQEFGIAPDRIALFGRSAGAHLALLAAYSAGDSRLPPTCLDTESGENVRAVVSFYAPTDLLWDFDNTANEFVINGPLTLSNFLGGNPHESAEIREKYILASPVAHISPETPPTLFVHGGQDQLVRVENMQFAAEKLEKANVSHRTILIPYAQHGFDYNFNGWGSQITKSVMLEFLNENTKAEQ